VYFTHCNGQKKEKNDQDEDEDEEEGKNEIPFVFFPIDQKQD
jgi:hypothetical protein